MQVCMYALIDVCMYIRVCGVCVRARVGVGVGLCICMYMYVYVCICMYTKEEAAWLAFLPPIFFSGGGFVCFE